MCDDKNASLFSTQALVKPSLGRISQWTAALCALGSLGLLLLLASGPRAAIAQASVETLDQFIQSLDTFQANFEQTLYDGNSEPLKTSTGSISVKRPGRFVWTYDNPDPQVIVADGENIWLYDKDLEQVTVNAIDDRLAGTPLQLLMSASSLEASFVVEALGESDGIDWFELKPKVEQSDFELVFIGLVDNSIAAMELRDNFGQATQIKFTDFDADVELDDSLFSFEVPEGVDLIGLDGQ